MKYSTQGRIERLLMTIDQLGMVKIKHLQQIHDLKSYRNACRVVKQLSPYVNETFYTKEKVIYLNKAGRDLIASDKIVTPSANMIHSLLRNDVYIYFDCPIDWKNEFPLECTIGQENSFGVKFQHLNLGTKKKVVCDALFNRNGYTYLIEVDNTRDMRDNKKKIESYKEILPKLNMNPPIICFVTQTEDRKRKLKKQLEGVRNLVMTFSEIR